MWNLTSTTSYILKFTHKNVCCKNRALGLRLFEQLESCIDIYVGYFCVKYMGMLPSIISHEKLTLGILWGLLIIKLI